MTMVHRRIVILVENQYQELELWYPLLRLREEGVEAKLVGPGIEETFLGRHGFPAKAEMVTSSVSPKDFDGIIIPGGFAPDYLRRLPVVTNLVREMYQQGKLIGALSRGPWVLISADIVRGKRIAGLISLRDDINNAGGEFVDAPVVVDGNIITARGPNELPLFMREVLAFLWRSRPRLNEPHPDGWLIDGTGNMLSLAQLLRGKPALVLFFDSGFSPRGMTFLPRYNGLAERVERKGGLFIGISTESIFTHQELQRRLQLAFPLYSDVFLEVTKAFGVLGASGLAEWAVMLIDAHGVLRFAERCPGGDVESLPGFQRKFESLFG
uniref:DJ-1/PfpI/YhbO family deglycase/protease n=1 Tax=Candidatus Caldatribacterium californiense TaxID=1454726 RepID=A0A7V4DDN3_9BACT